MTKARETALKNLGAAWNHAQFQAQRIEIEQLLANGQNVLAYEAAINLLQQARAVGTQAYDGADYDLASASLLLARALWKTNKTEQALQLLTEAKQGFDAIATEHNDNDAARMALVCLAEQGICLSHLGRFEQAEYAYQENIRLAEQLNDEPQVAIGKRQLGMVYLDQGRYQEAMSAFEQARDHFIQLKNWVAVARAWNLIGIVHQTKGQLEAAEVAYQKSYQLAIQFDYPIEKADALGQLGHLYNIALNYPEQAINFYQQAADIYQKQGDKAKEDVVKRNLADSLRKLHRYDEARHAIQQAITCKAEFGHAAMPWTAWQILANLETDCGNLVAASTAKQKAIAAYLAYRRDGGENHTNAGRIAHAVRQALSTDGTAAIALLEDYLADPKWQAFHTYLNALIAVLNGNQNPSLADAADLDYGMAAEILLLIES